MDDIFINALNEYLQENRVHLNNLFNSFAFSNNLNGVMDDSSFMCFSNASAFIGRITHTNFKHGYDCNTCTNKKIFIKEYHINVQTIFKNIVRNVDLYKFFTFTDFTDYIKYIKYGTFVKHTMSTLPLYTSIESTIKGTSLTQYRLNSIPERNMLDYASYAVDNILKYVVSMYTYDDNSNCNQLQLSLKVHAKRTSNYKIDYRYILTNKNGSYEPTTYSDLELKYIYSELIKCCPLYSYAVPVPGDYVIRILPILLCSHQQDNTISRHYTIGLLYGTTFEWYDPRHNGGETCLGINTFLNRFAKVNDLNYVAPENVCSISLQQQELNAGKQTELPNEPIGYCVSYSLLYLEMKLKNIKLESQILHSYISKNIVNLMEHYMYANNDSNLLINPILQFIRYYTALILHGIVVNSNRITYGGTKKSQKEYITFKTGGGKHRIYNKAGHRFFYMKKQTVLLKDVRGKYLYVK